MAGFKTHITVSSALGVGYGAAAHFGLGVPWPTSVLAAGLCGVSGMLPDLDSGPGVPLRESCAFAAAVVPMMLLDRFQQWGMSNEMIVLAGAACYFLIRFGLAELLKKYTVHRGMFHSLLAALIFAEIAFLLSSGEIQWRIVKAVGVLLGFVSHLALDELYSIEWRRGRVGIKKSFGTALKIFGKSMWANALAIALLAGVTYLTCNEPSWMRMYCQQAPVQSIEQPPPPGEKQPTVLDTAAQWLKQWLR
ncbi:MAG: metal-dependent hydrolase [Pirellulales bacterium]|nr:metal-dependent hydrolase [Pirellulales bacterium]